MAAAVIDGRYRILEELGRGGMGTVYRVRDETAGEERALKLLDLSGDERDYLAHFEQEFLSLTELRHPNLVRVHDFGVGGGPEGDRPYFTMELVAGRPLSERFSPPLEFPALYRALAGVLRALAYLHAREFVHSDVSAANILVHGDPASEEAAGSVKLMDLGLLDTVRHTEPGRIRGTLGYLPPERLRGGRLDGRADLYSLGVVLYETVTGRLPFTGSTLETIRGHLETVPTPPTHLNPEVPASLEEVILRLLEKEPSARYAGAEAALDALARASAGVLELPGSPSAPGRALAARFVGREREMESLAEALDRALAGKGGTLLVSGEAGSGKTRLLQEVRARAQVAGLKVVTLRCSSASPSPLEQLAERVSPLLADERPPDDLERLRAVLGGALDAPRPGAGLRSTAPAAALLQAAAARAPLLLFLEDLQGADEGLVHLLSYLCRTAGDRGGGEAAAPLVLAALREEELPRGGGLEDLLAQLRDEGLLREVRLRPLGPEACSRLASSMLGLAELAPGWGEALAVVSRGNPLHLEALVEERVAAGALRPGAQPPPPEEVLDPEAAPGGSRDLLAARIEGLRPPLREILAAAAVIGESFEPEALEPLLDGQEIDAGPGLVELVRAGLLEHRAEAEGLLCYRFTPPALARVARETQSEKERANLHLRRARWLERLPAVPGRAASIAHHWLEAGRPERAVGPLAEAARETAARGALREALARAEKALSILRREETSPAEELCRLFELRGGLRLALGEAAGAEDDFRWMEARAEKEGTPELAARAREMLGEVLRDRGRLEPALEALDRALAGYDELGDTAGGARTLLALGRTLAALDRREEADERLSSAVQQAERAGAREIRVRVWLARAELLVGAGHSRQAVETLRAALEEAGRLDSPELRLEARLALAAGLEAEGRPGEAAAGLGEAAEEARRLGDLPARIEALSRLGAALERSGDRGGALGTLEEALALARRTGDATATAEILESLARFHLRRGRAARALESADEALRWARRSGREEHLARVLALAGAAYREVGDHLRARHALRESLEIARGRKSAPVQTLALRELGRLSLAEGELESARSSFQESCFLARRSGDPGAETKGMLLLADSYLSAGDPSRAALALRKASEAVSARGRPSEVAALHLVSARLEARRPGGDRALALREAEAALEAHEELEEAEAVWRAHHLLGSLLLEEEDREGALEHYRKAFLHVDGVAAQLPERWREAYRRAHPRRDFLDEWERLGARAGTARRDRHSSRTGPVPVPAAVPAEGGRERDLERLLEINAKLNSTLELRPLLETLVDTAVELAGADRGLVLLGGRGALELEVGRGPAGEALSAEESEWSHSLASQVLDTGEPVLSADTLADGRFSESRSVRDLRIRSVVAVPLRARGENAGALVLESRDPSTTFDDSHLELLGRLGEQAGLAVGNARLVEELRRRGERIEQLNDELKKKIDSQAADLESARIEILEKQSNLELRYRYDRIIGASPAMQKVYDILDKVVPTRIPVLVTGESGTGKELIARAIHYNGPRKKARFTTVNCAALTDTLLESELFGHKKGAFTGADRDREGLFVAADGGTLFLDEVGDMSPAMQAKLLRALQEGEVRPVGGRAPFFVDVRVVSATNRDLHAMVREKAFREDLYYRLNVASIAVPPLRERKEDLGLLAEHFLDRYREEHAGGDPSGRRSMTGGALRLLALHDWPGNIRELEHEITKLAAFAAGEVIDEAEVRANAGFLAAPRKGSGGPPSSVSLEETEIRQIKKALEMSGGNRTQAARLLGINRATLHRKIRRYGLD